MKVVKQTEKAGSPFWRLAPCVVVRLGRQEGKGGWASYEAEAAFILARCLLLSLVFFFEEPPSMAATAAAAASSGSGDETSADSNTKTACPEQ